MPLEQQQQLGAKQGRPSLLVDLRVVDGNTGAELPRDGRSAGELQFKGPHVIFRYANAPEPAVVTLGKKKSKGSKDSDLFFPTGDLATIDEVSFFFLNFGKRKDEERKKNSKHPRPPHPPPLIL